MTELLRYAKQQVRGAITSLRSLRYFGSVQRLGRKASLGYIHYLAVQVEKSKRYVDRTNQRSPNLIGRTSEQLTCWPAERRAAMRVLCVGCRNGYELDLFEQAGFGRVLGADLFQSDPRIQVMDMHQLDLSDQSVDVVYSCHSLEHSYDPRKAIAEFTRVLKPGGVCVVEVPVGFRKSQTDRQDFGSVEGLKRAFGPLVGQVLFCEEEQPAGAARVARLAFHLQGSSGERQAA